LEKPDIIFQGDYKMSKTKKSRLDENQVRRFMGLANLHPLGEGFLDRIREEDDLPPEEGGEGLPPEGEEMPPEEPLEADAAEAGPPTEETAEVATEMAQDVADAVAVALSDALGQHGVEVTSGDAEGGGEEALPVEEPPVEELPGEELPGEEEELEELESAGIEVVDDDRLVQEVARRVAARLLKESKTTPRRKTRTKTRTKRS
jgi:hypothetical protein